MVGYTFGTGELVLGKGLVGCSYVYITCPSSQLPNDPQFDNRHWG